MSTVLVTGGAGFIGSHVAQTLMASGYDVIIVDSRYNHTEDSNNVELLRMFEYEGSGRVIGDYRTSIIDFSGLLNIFTEHKVDIVVHCAGLKSVNESEEHPFRYFQTNCTGTQMLLAVMHVSKVTRIIFASSAGIYGGTRSYFHESDDVANADHNYGKTKRICESILRDSFQRGELEQCGILRIANPVDLITPHHFKEDVTGEVTNLIPVIRRCAENDKPFRMRLTPSGFPARRDYIAVQDVSRSFKSAIDYLEDNPSCQVWNISTGKQCSTREIFDYVTTRHGYDIIAVDVEAGKTERDSLALDNRKMIEDFGFTPMDIHAMVRRT